MGTQLTAPDSTRTYLNCSGRYNDLPESKLKIDNSEIERQTGFKDFLRFEVDFKVSGGFCSTQTFTKIKPL